MKLITEPYKFFSKYTEETYNYIVKEVLDKTKDISGYKDIPGNPEDITKIGVASEIYTFFLSHYFKAAHTYLQLDDIMLNQVKSKINIIDIGASIGTVTYAYIDLLVEKIGKDISFDIVFIEPHAYKVELLEKSIQRYRILSGLDISYNIINKYYEESVDDILMHFQKEKTIILISNLLHWIKDMNKFKDSLLNNIMGLDSKANCSVMSIETVSGDADEKLLELYNSINEKQLYLETKLKSMPSFYNIKECYYYINRKKYCNPKKKFRYGYIIRDTDILSTINNYTIERAFFKALYSVRSSYICDEIEIKYINSNRKQVVSYICNLMDSSEIADNFCYQFQMKKDKNKTRPLYIDDFINDIIYTSILITKGVTFDKLQNDNVSFGNRLNREIESPFIFKSFHTQFFSEYRKRVSECSRGCKYYLKIDLKSYYTSISHKKIKDIFEENNKYGSKWYNNMIEKFLNKSFDCCNKGFGLPQGPDISHLLANMYLKEFDDWFHKEFPSSHLLRYVDDMIILSDSSEACEEIYSKCKTYLETNLCLETNKDKEDRGEVKELLLEQDASYFEQVSKSTEKILRSLYKLDKANFQYYKDSPRKFIDIYQRCLKRLGIYLTRDWLNIKINKELSFLEKLKELFKKDSKLSRWILNKNIYYKLNIGSVPSYYNDDEIDNWASEFKIRNKRIMKDIEKVKKLLDEKMQVIIGEVKSNEGKGKELKSLFKYTFNRMQVFKCKNLSTYINDVLKYFPYCNKKVLSSYDEFGDLLEGLLAKIISNYNEYDYAIYIWLLGEYGSDDKIMLLEDLFEVSYKDRQYFINTLVAEAILKIGKSTDKFNDNLRAILHGESNYYFVRNILILLNKYMSKYNFDELLGNIESNDERTILFIEWIKDNKGIDITSIVDEIPEEFKAMYPEYPISNQYPSF